jgi:hypothetical protein
MSNDNEKQPLLDDTLEDAVESQLLTNQPKVDPSTLEVRRNHLQFLT